MSARLTSVIDRVGELLSELETEYNRCLREKEVSDKVLNLFHETIEKCSNTLDQCFYAVWDRRVRPQLTQDTSKARVYFPVALDEHSLRSTLGRALCANLEELDPELFALLLKWQPYRSGDANLPQLKELAAAKHTGLIPQKRQEETRTTVTGPGGGSVSWGPGVTFGSGVSIMGVPVDPRTQQPVPNTFVTTKKEVWVRFKVEDRDLDAFSFAKKCAANTRSIAGELIDLLP